MRLAHIRNYVTKKKVISIAPDESLSCIFSSKKVRLYEIRVLINTILLLI